MKRAYIVHDNNETRETRITRRSISVFSDDTEDNSVDISMGSALESFN